MQKDKACTCVTSRMFPHRESKCSLRTNPAASFRTMVNQTSSGLSSFVSSPDSRATVPPSPTYTTPEVTKIENAEEEYKVKTDSVKNTESNIPSKNHAINDDDDGLAEALLAIAMLESSSHKEMTPISNEHDDNYSSVPVADETVDVSSSVVDNLLDFSAGFETEEFESLPTILEESSVPVTPSEEAVHSEGMLLESDSAVTPLTVPTAEVYTPTYALPCSADEMASLQAAQVLQGVYDREDSVLHNSSSSSPVTNNKTAKDNKCTCVSSRMFPHRASKCSMRSIPCIRSPGASTTSTAASTDSLVPAKAEVVDAELLAVGYKPTEQEEDGSDPELSDTVSGKQGSRPCRCVSSSMFPHRANKCTLLNANKQAQAAVRSAVSSSSGGGSAKKSVAPQTAVLTEEQVAAQLKYRQEVSRIPHHTLLYSLLHMTGANILYIGAVCLVFVGGFGVVDKVIRLVCGVLRGVLWR